MRNGDRLWGGVLEIFFGNEMETRVWEDAWVDGAFLSRYLLDCIGFVLTKRIWWGQGDGGRVAFGCGNGDGVETY